MPEKQMFPWPPEYRRNLKRKDSYRFAALLWGSRGDVQPFIALGGELVRRGHQAVVAARERYRALAEEQGVEFFPMPEDGSEEFMKAMAGAKGVSDMLPLSASYSRGILEQQFRSFGQASRGADVILTKAISTMPAFHIAEQWGLPIFIAHIDPGFIPSEVFCMGGGKFQDKGKGINRLIGHMMLFAFSLTVADRINAWRVQHRMPPDRLARRNHASHLFRFPTFAVWSPLFLKRSPDWPEWYVQTGWWKLPRKKIPDPRLRDFVLSKPPPLYIGFGSWDVHDKTPVTEMILEALRITGDRAVLMRDTVDQRKEFPPNVLVADYPPHEWLFPRVKAAVHHGGAGTTGTASMAGIPSIIIPAFAAQAPWGHLVAEQKIGMMLDRHGLQAEQLAAAIREVDRPEIRSQARKIADLLWNEGGVEQAADEVERRLKEATAEHKIHLARPAVEPLAAHSKGKVIGPMPSPDVSRIPRIMGEEPVPEDIVEEE